MTATPPVRTTVGGGAGVVPTSSRGRCAPRSTGSPTTCGYPATKSGITPTRLAALAALARHGEGCRQGDLAAQMGVSPASMTRLVDIMAEAELGSA